MSTLLTFSYVSPLGRRVRRCFWGFPVRPSQLTSNRSAVRAFDSRLGAKICFTFLPRSCQRVQLPQSEHYAIGHRRGAQRADRPELPIAVKPPLEHFVRGVRDVDIQLRRGRVTRDQLPEQKPGERG